MEKEIAVCNAPMGRISRFQGRRWTVQMDKWLVRNAATTWQQVLRVRKHAGGVVSKSRGESVCIECHEPSGTCWDWWHSRCRRRYGGYPRSRGFQRGAQRTVSRSRGKRRKNTSQFACGRESLFFVFCLCAGRTRLNTPVCDM